MFDLELMGLLREYNNAQSKEKKTNSLHLSQDSFHKTFLKPKSSLKKPADRGSGGSA